MMKKLILLILPVFLFYYTAHTQFTVSFSQLNIGCSGGNCDGEVKAQGIGGTAPYHYDWKTSSINASDSSIAINLCEGLYHMSVTDANGFKVDTSIFITVHSAPEIEITSDIGDTWYIQNPSGQFFYENLSADTILIEGWVWDLGDDNSSFDHFPRHTYQQVGNYDIVFTANYKTKCSTSISYSIGVKTVKLLIPNIITPNGDGANDVFIITQDNRNDNSQQFKSAGIYPKVNDFYISNELIIFNRWSQKVYQQSNYQNDWDGENLSDGVYYFVLKCHGEFEDDVFRGSLTILGANR